MRYILRTCKGREDKADYIKKHLPNIEICFDDVGGAMQNFLKSLEMSGGDGVVNLEDDIILTENFLEKIEAVIADKPNTLIQFFSMRKKDITVGSRWDYGRLYLMGQCTYFPPMYSLGILKFAKTYSRINHKSQPLDSMVADYLDKIKQKYWIHCPNLVDHVIGKSAIDPKRASTNRQSFTFVDGVK